MKLYESRENFAEIYPFIPYQFNLLGKVLNSIRTHGASGKHLSEGERSMLALFKKAAERLQNKMMVLWCLSICFTMHWKTSLIQCTAV